MRLRRLRAAVFGPHRDRDLDLDADVVLVFGRNESGKSCFRSAIETILYGFDPAKRETHPLAQWNEGSGGDVHVEADLALDDGSVQRVERVLQADGKSRTAEEGEPFEGARQGNAPLPLVAGLPRKLFQSIYAVEIEQLAALEAGVQEHVDDLLLPEAESLRLRSISQIRESLGEDHQRLWRRDRRGKQRVQELLIALSEARRRAHDAALNEGALRSALAEQAELEVQLAADRDEKARLEQVARDAPYLRELFELCQRKRQLGEPVDISGLGDLPLVDPVTLEREIEEVEEELRGPRARLAREATVLAEHHRAALSATAEIQVAIAAAPEHAAEIRRRDAAAARAEARRREAEDAIAGVLTRGPEPGNRERVAALPMAQLRSAQASWARAWEEHVAAPAAARPPAWTLALAAVGVGVASAAAFLARGPWAVLLGVLLTAAAAVAAFVARAQPRRDRREPPERPPRVAEILADLSVAREFFASPAELLRLLDALADVQRTLGEATGAEEEASQVEPGIRAHEHTWSALCAQLGLDGEGGGDLLVERLRQAFDVARAAEKEVERDAAERRQSRTEIEAKEPIVARQRTHLEAVERTLRRAEPDAASLGEAFRRVRERMKGEDFVREREAQLAADARHDAFREDPRVTAERGPDDADWLDEITAQRNARIKALDAATEAATERRGELRNQLREDEGSHSARALDAVCALEEELAEVKRERDRLALLDSILGRAEQEFREEHQPDVLRRASTYLARVTSGRYHRLDYFEGEDGGLHVACVDRSEPVRVDAPISRGTLDQIFLCLRLGLLDHLDRDREKLPLVLDDALLRIDDARRPQVYALLADISTARQVFLLTCHAAIADEAEAALKASRIDLSPG
ncbi:MAG: AAA family ATPase [Planctomycetota bacterium]